MPSHRPSRPLAEQADAGAGTGGPRPPVVSGRGPSSGAAARPGHGDPARESGRGPDLPGHPGAGPDDPVELDLDLVVPILRGVSHVYSAYVAALAGVVLVVIAPDATARACSVLYGASLVALFGLSGLLHRWRGDRRWEPTLRRLDHCSIFVFIASCITVLAVQVLSGPTQTVVLALAWAGAIAGVSLSLAWIDAPRGVASASYLLVSWAAVVGVPQMVDRLPVAPLVLIGLGALLYTAGALVYAFRRPDPWPEVFGFHEVFHALTIVAAAVHFAALAGWVLGGTAG